MSRRPGNESALTREELVRYERQLLLPAIGPAGQEKLRRARVVVAGVGGLGCPAAVYLVCAGVGHLVLVDADAVELSNLNRQILHWEEDIGKKKVLSAAGKLGRLNSGVRLEPLALRIGEANAEELVRGADLVIDAVDNLETRLLLNRACYRASVPLIHGGISGLLGEVTTIIPGKTPCLACLFPRPPKGKGPIPVVGVTPGLVGTLQAMEALKLLLGFGEPLAGRMLYVNGETMTFSTVALTPRPDCPVCQGVSVAP